MKPLHFQSLIIMAYKDRVIWIYSKCGEAVYYLSSSGV
jgi:hypothetical protein